MWVHRIFLSFNRKSKAIPIRINKLEVDQNKIMKKLLFLISLLLLCQQGFSQTIAKDYDGTIKLPGIELDLSIHLENMDKQWTGTLDIPKQNIKGMVLSELTVDDDTLSFKLPEVPGNATYSGTFSTSFDQIVGTFTQGGQKLELVFKRLDDAAKEQDKQIVARLKVLSDSLMLAHHIPGMGFGIIKNGEVILNEGFGYRDYDNKIKADAKTVFAIGSCTKAFTAAGVATLSDQNLIEWNEPIKSYIPDFELYDEFASEQSNSVDILTHRSGLPRHDFMWYGSPATRMQMFSKLKHLEPTEGFRTTFQYQNLMYMTAGILIEKMSGQSWEDYTKQKIIDPLGMTDTNFSVEESKKVENHALPYRVEDEKIIKMDFRNIDEVGPAGSINSTVNDMLKWAELNLDRGKWNGKEIISESQYDILHNGQMLVTGPLAARAQPEYSAYTYGGGWFIFKYAGTKVIQHGGNIDGFSGFVWLLPEENIGMVFMCNVNGSPLPGILANYATDMFLGNEVIKWEKRVWPDKEEAEDKKEEKDRDIKDDTKIAGTKPSLQLREYTGKFVNEGYSETVVRLEDNTLKLAYNSFDLSLEHFHYNVFEGSATALGDQKLKVQFHQDLRGRIKSLSVALEPSLDPIIFDRLIPKQHSDPDYFSKVTGKYKLDALLVNVEVKAGRLYLSPVGQPSFMMESSAKDEFEFKGLPGYSIKFKFEGQEKATDLIMYQPNGTGTAKRIE